MLQFILGKPSSGKTYTVIEKIKELSNKNKQVLLLVPEQFTFESERLILKALGDSAALNTTVLSFSRLYDEVGRRVGGIAGTVLGEADKVIFMSRTLKLLKDELTLWRKYTGSVSFAKAMLDTIGEFKINACSFEDLELAAEAVESPTLKAKLKEISLIYRQYDMLVGEKFIDPTDSLTKLYYTLGNFDYFKEKTVFIDSFKGFTGQQFKIIERILSGAENVYISLTDNPENNRDYNVYSNIRAAAEHIKKYAASSRITVNEPIVLNDTYFYSSEIKAVEELISSKRLIEFNNDNSVILSKENDIYSEADAIARTIRRLVRTENYRYRDFVIIARSAEDCSEAVANACKRNNVSCFYDNRVPLSAFPVASAVAAAIDAIALGSNDILRFNKTGLGNLSFEETSSLENYVYIWGIEGEAWLRDWDMDPRGLTNNPISKDELAKKIQQINNLRVRAITPILNFKNRFNTNSKAMVEAIMKLLEECDFSEKLLEISEFADNDSDYGLEVLKSAYEQYIAILNSLIKCYGNMSISIKEFSESLALAVSLASVGVIPQMLDEVTFGSADRIRPSRPKIAFIIGANQGVFPQFTSNNGLFNVIERKSLITAGLNVADNSVRSAIDEEYLVYCNLCCPSDRLYISYSKQTVSGEPLEPSGFVIEISNKLGIEILENRAETLPESEATAFSEYCRNKLNSPDKAITIAEALKNTTSYEKIVQLNLGVEKALNSKTAKKLYGNNLKLSATKFDTFNRCKFSFFCRYGLGAKKLQSADFNVMQRGTIVHFVLERLISDYSETISSLNDTKLDILTEQYINEYLDSIIGYRTNENAKSKFLVSRIARSLKEVIHHIRNELSQSDFKPVACELGVGTENDEINVTFPFDSGNISILGSIDRVDEYNGYIRIIDYKTGSKSFKLPDILFGLNLQMLIYLYAVIRGRNLPDSSAAGILYQPSSRDINDKGLAMNGLLPLDPEVVFAMDKQGMGEFVPPLKIKRDGSFSESSSFVEKPDFSEIFDYIELLMKKTGNSIVSGDISVNPTDGRESAACKYCDFSNICDFKNGTAEVVPSLKNKEVIERIKEVKQNGI